MDAVVMAGGLGTRLDMGENPMVKLLGRPLIDYVLTALEESSIDRIFVAVTPNVPKTRKWVVDRNIEVVDTPGEGYVPDMIFAVETANIQNPVMIVMSDLPLLKGDIVDEILDVYDDVPEPALSVHVPLGTHGKIGTKPDALFNYEGHFITPAGVNILDGMLIRFEQEDHHLVLDRIELALNVNTAEDLKICESVLDKDEYNFDF